MHSSPLAQQPKNRSLNQQRFVGEHALKSKNRAAHLRFCRRPAGFCVQQEPDGDHQRLFQPNWMVMPLCQPNSQIGCRVSYSEKSCARIGFPGTCV